MNLEREIKTIFAPIIGIAALLWGLYELYDTLNKIKMVVDVINFLFGSYNSATSAWTNFTLWKSNATYLVVHPVFNALPFLDVVPGIVWSFLKALVLLLFGLWILDQVIR
jgi:hypothetical protein